MRPILAAGIIWEPRDSSKNVGAAEVGVQAIDAEPRGEVAEELAGQGKELAPRAGFEPTT